MERMTRSGAPTFVEPPIARRRGLVCLASIDHESWERVRGQIEGWLADGTKVFVQAILVRTAVLCDDEGVRTLIRRSLLWVRPGDIVIIRNKQGDQAKQGRENALKLRYAR